ncbi:MAG: DUF2974 domain-containing protein [Tabrizicola sp.]|nr:DUF2974 domain-containing protein [Tabrizicola sp.]
MNASTRISGNGDWQPCLNKAAMLILDIYDYADADLTPRLRQEKARLWDHWERSWHLDLPSGMFCRMYHPKRSGRQTPLDVCPPALVFRGSEMNAADIDELAVHVEVKCTVSTTGVMSWVAESNTFTPVIPTISPNGRFPPTATRADLRAAGMLEQPLVLPSTGRVTIGASVGPIGVGSMHIDWTGSASLFYGANGDWPTNISQALGQVPSQYVEAMRAARKAADEAIADWNGRLLILGHSLGGGLASCAALAAKSHKPDLQLKCDTYNASGLHSATARAAGARLSDASRAGIKARQVAGDVLTSLQTPNLIPLVADVLRWGNVTLPPAIPASMPNHGVSPGGPPSMMFTKWERAPEWRVLPTLFPLANQTLVATRFEQLNRLFGAARAPDFRTFVNNLVTMLFTALGDGNGRLRTWHMADFYQAQGLAVTQARNAGAGFVREVNTPPPISTVPYFSLGTSDYMRSQVEPFFNGMFRDAIGFTHIMKAAVDYHMWDACAYTFLLEQTRR